jgi:hypothetical protein
VRRNAGESAACLTNRETLVVIVCLDRDRVVNQVCEGDDRAGSFSVMIDGEGSLGCGLEIAAHIVGGTKR